MQPMRMAAYELLRPHAMATVPGYPGREIWCASCRCSRIPDPFAKTLLKQSLNA